MAKKRHRQIALVPTALLLVLTVFGSTPAQTRSPVFGVPKKLVLDKIVRQMFPGYYGGQPYRRLYTDGFFPIGWSRDGKFAYYVEPVDEACGCYFASLVIQDMRTDKILWEFKYNQDDQDESGKTRSEDTIKKLWAKNRKLFADKLSENGIEAVSQFALFGRSFSSGGKSFTAAVAAPKGKDDDGMPRVRSVTLALTSTILGRKILYSVDYKGDMYTAPLDAGVAGVFKSPFENRVAIVLIEVNRGYEGPPNIVSPRMSGADLASGFSKGK